MNKVLLENGVLIYLCVIYACFVTRAAGLSLWDIYYNAHNLVFKKKKIFADPYFSPTLLIFSSSLVAEPRQSSLT